MTLKVTISHAMLGYAKDALVSQSNGAPDTRISSGQSVDFYVHSGNTLTVTEVDAVSTPDLHGGPGDVRPPV